VGVPGPGEPVLIAAAVLAARSHLGIYSVLVVAFLAAFLGGVAGWLVGRKAGRGLMTAPGPLLRFRKAAVARGDHIFDRYAFVAVLLTPAWIAGIHDVRTPVFLFANAVGAALWAVGIGMAAYLIGPSVVDAADDEGLVVTLIVVAVVVSIVGAEIVRRRRKRAHEA
jgi:membrane protein DedA with SNARE-associated domain